MGRRWWWFCNFVWCQETIRGNVVLCPAKYSFWDRSPFKSWFLLFQNAAELNDEQENETVYPWWGFFLFFLRRQMVCLPFDGKIFTFALLKPLCLLWHGGKQNVLQCWCAGPFNPSGVVGTRPQFSMCRLNGTTGVKPSFDSSVGKEYEEEVENDDDEKDCS